MITLRTIIVCLLIVFLFTLFVIRKKTSSKKTGPVSPTPTTTNTSVSTSSAKKEKFDFGKNFSKILGTLMTIAVILFVIWMIFELGKGVINFVKKESHIYEKVETAIRITDDTYIEFWGDYDVTYVLPRGVNFGFREASEPYCVLNNYLVEACVGIGEDASSYLPRGEGNLKLKFKSTNGKKCRLKIIIY